MDFKIKNLIKNFKNNRPYLFSLILFVIFFFLINKISKNFLEQTKLEKRTVPEFLERVYGEKDIKDFQELIKEQTSSFEYREFVEFGEKERLGKFTIVSPLGDRCNYNEQINCNLPNGGKKEIWVFGGSTTFGYGVKNNQTIAAYLEALFKKKFEVKNFGTGFYYSTQERILLNDLLIKFDSPYAIIFIDGLNEFYKEYNSYQTQFTDLIKYKMNKTSADDFKDYFLERFNNLNFIRLIKEKIINKKKDLIKENLNEDEIKKMVNIFKQNQKIIKGVSKEYNLKIVQVLQPVPIYNDSYQSSKIPKEFEISFENNLRFKKLKKGYEIYLSDLPSYVLNLSDLKIVKPMYIDGVHYSPDFNLAIAENIMLAFPK